MKTHTNTQQKKFLFRQKKSYIKMENKTIHFKEKSVLSLLWNMAIKHLLHYHSGLTGGKKENLILPHIYHLSKMKLVAIFAIWNFCSQIFYHLINSSNYNNSKKVHFFYQEHEITLYFFVIILICPECFLCYYTLLPREINLTRKCCRLS